MSAPAVAWRDVLQRWALVEADLHAIYGVDVGDRAIMKARSWRWLRTRIVGLLAADTRLTRALTPAGSEPVVAPEREHDDGG